MLLFSSCMYLVGLSYEEVPRSTNRLILHTCFTIITAARRGELEQLPILIGFNLGPQSPFPSGLHLACELRRNFLVRNRIFIASGLSVDDLFDSRNSDGVDKILSAKGTGYLRLPIDEVDLKRLSEEAEPLTSDSLNEVILQHTNLWSAWAETVHFFERNIRDCRRTDAVTFNEQFDRWAGFFSTVQPELHEDFLALRSGLTNGSFRTPDTALRSLARFDSLVVQGNAPEQNSIAAACDRVLPKCPPKGFSKLLIADDNPQDFLAITLRSEYRYNVVLPQAMKLIEAKHLLDKHNPDVVLADLYFKESTRLTEVPKKSIGERFIRYATKDERRLVLVTSKATIRAADLLAGTINCSGLDRASSAYAVHQTIWDAAAGRGITEPETIDSQEEWGPEVTCRQRLEPYKELLPKIIKQWSLFPTLVGETLNLTLLLEKIAQGPDRALVEDFLQVLRSSQDQQDFSTKSIRDLFRETKEIHERAKVGAETKIRQGIRNILHGKIEQSSSVMNAVDEALYVMIDVAKRLSALPQCQNFGDSLNAVLQTFSETDDLLPFLGRFKTALDEILDGLPSMPAVHSEEHAFRVNGQTFRVVIVEDSPYWKTQVLDVCDQLTLDYGGHHEFIVESFDNSAEVLATLERRNTTHVIAGENVGPTTIAILDISIPRDKQHSQNIQDAASGKSKLLSYPEFSHGLELIRTLSEFRYNIPIIVFSTIDSIIDRKKVCGWGVAEANFISKGPDAHEHLRSALHRLVEKSNKYIISRHTLGEVGEEERSEGAETEEIFPTDSKSTFYINGLVIKFPPALFDTFMAIYDLCQSTGERTLTVDEIIKQKGDSNKKELHDHINRIRVKLFETAHRNRVYLNVQELIRTRFNNENGEYVYEVNADIPTVDEEYQDPWNEDREALASRNKVLLLGDDPAFAEISALLSTQSFEVTECTKNLAIHDGVLAFDTDMVVISTKVGDPSTQWKSVRGASLDKDVGIMFVSETEIEPRLVNQLLQAGVPLNNLVTTSAPNWLNNFLQAFESERIRMFVGDAPDLSKDHSFPVVEILDGTDLDAGILDLLVDERSIKMNPRDNGVHTKIIGQLLASPGKTLSWPELESRAALPKSPTKNNKKTWPSRLRNNVIAGSWVDPMDGNPMQRAKLILESSSEGLRLNVTTIDLR